MTVDRAELISLEIWLVESLSSTYFRRRKSSSKYGALDENSIISDSSLSGANNGVGSSVLSQFSF